MSAQTIIVNCSIMRFTLEHRTVVRVAAFVTSQTSGSMPFEETIQKTTGIVPLALKQ